MAKKLRATFVDTYNELLLEVEKLVLRSVDGQHETSKKFKELANKLQCPSNANSATIEDKMKHATQFFKTVGFQGKSALVLGPPVVKKKNSTKCKSISIVPEKLPEERLQLDISHTVMVSNKEDFNAVGGKAIPLCLPNDCKWNERTNECKKDKSITRDRLVINSEAIKILEKITGPVSVVSIVGPCRTGKSYILSRLISSQQYTERRFRLGHKMDPETMGIWMWSVPLKYRLKNGEEVTIILLDTEGIDAYNADKQGDTQIFTLSVLLSSLLIYNSTQVPRREDLNQMTFIANLAKSIGSKGSKQLSRQEIKQIAPSFLWLLRDAILEPVDNHGRPCHFREYLLEKVLSSQVADSSSFDDTPSIQVQASKCLLEFFVSLDAEMIPPPSTNAHVMANIEDPRYRNEISPDFLHQVEFVRCKILEKCQPKRGYTEGSLMNGMQFRGILQVYVDALNTPQGIPKVASAWDQVMKNTYQTATQRAIEEYKKSMDSLQFPVEDDVIQAHHTKSYEESVRLFKQLTQLDSDGEAYEKHLEELSATISGGTSAHDSLLNHYHEENRHKSEIMCSELLQSLKEKHLSPLMKDLSPTTEYTELIKAVDTIEETYEEKSIGPGKSSMYTKFMKALEEEREQFQAQLSRMKNYDEQINLKTRELGEQMLMYEQQQKEKKDLEMRLHSNKLKVEALQEKMTSTEERLKKEAERKEKEHSRQLQNLEHANLKIQQQFGEYEKRNQANVSNLQSTINSLQSHKAQLQNQISALQSSLNQQPAPRRRSKKCVIQ